MTVEIDLDVLLKARETIMEKGWGQGMPLQRAQEGSVCVGEAIQLACAGRDRSITQFDAVTHLLVGLLGEKSTMPVAEIVHWNDEPGRTQEDAIILLDQAIAELKRQDSGGGSGDGGG